ncbi:MAG: hypothetical protein AB1414_12405 [bacterium]
MRRSIIKLFGLVVLTLLIPLSANAVGTITNTAELEYKDLSGGTYTDTGTCTIRKLGTVNVTIVKTSRNITRRGTGTEYFDTETGIAGDLIEYKITLENQGEDMATFTVVKDTLPDDVIYATESIRLGTRTLTDAQNDDEGNFTNETIIIGRDEEGTTGNLAGISLNGGAKIEIYYRVRIK